MIEFSGSRRTTQWLSANIERVPLPLPHFGCCSLLLTFSLFCCSFSCCLNGCLKATVPASEEPAHGHMAVGDKPRFEKTAQN